MTRDEASTSTRIREYIRGNILGLVAIYIALGGVGWAAATIGSGDIETNAVRSKHIKAGQVKSPDILDGTVGSADVASNGLDGSVIDESSLGQVPSAASADTAANGIDDVDGGITGNTGQNVLLFSLAEGSISVFCDDGAANFKYTNNSGATAQVFDDGTLSTVANGVTDAGREGDLMIATDDHLIHAHLQIEATGSDCPFAASFYELAL